MSQSKIERLISENYCCPYYYFLVSETQLTGEIAKELDVSNRAIQLWRKEFRAGRVTCEERKKCQK